MSSIYHLLQVGCSSYVQIKFKDLILDVTNKQALIVRPKSTPLCDRSGLAVKLSIERERIQCEN